MIAGLLIVGIAIYQQSDLTVSVRARAPEAQKSSIPAAPANLTGLAELVVRSRLVRTTEGDDRANQSYDFAVENAKLKQPSIASVHLMRAVVLDPAKIHAASQDERLREVVTMPRFSRFASEWLQAVLDADSSGPRDPVSGLSEKALGLVRTYAMLHGEDSNKVSAPELSRELNRATKQRPGVLLATLSKALPEHPHSVLRFLEDRQNRSVLDDEAIARAIAEQAQHLMNEYVRPPQHR